MRVVTMSVVLVLVAACGKEPQPVPQAAVVAPQPKATMPQTPTPTPTPAPKPRPAILDSQLTVQATAKDGGLAVVVTAPITGCVLRRDSVTRKSDTAEVQLTLVEPAVDDVVAETATAVPLQLLASDFPGCKHAIVNLATEMRGAQYLVQPAHKKVAAVDLP